MEARTENVRVVVKDERSTRRVKRARGRLLRRPRLLARVENVDVGRVGLVAVDDIDGVIELFTHQHDPPYKGARVLT